MGAEACTVRVAVTVTYSPTAAAFIWDGLLPGVPFGPSHKGTTIGWVLRHGLCCVAVKTIAYSLSPASGKQHTQLGVTCSPTCHSAPPHKEATLGWVLRHVLCVLQ